MENVSAQFENLKDRAFHRDKLSTWPEAVKFDITEKTNSTTESFNKEMSLSRFVQDKLREEMTRKR